MTRRLSDRAAFRLGERDAGVAAPVRRQRDVFRARRVPVRHVHHEVAVRERAAASAHEVPRQEPLPGATTTSPERRGARSRAPAAAAGTPRTTPSLVRNVFPADQARAASNATEARLMNGVPPATTWSPARSARAPRGARAVARSTRGFSRSASARTSRSRGWRHCGTGSTPRETSSPARSKSCRAGEALLLHEPFIVASRADEHVSRNVCFWFVRRPFTVRSLVDDVNRSVARRTPAPQALRVVRAAPPGRDRVRAGDRPAAAQARRRLRVAFRRVARCTPLAIGDGGQWGAPRDPSRSPRAPRARRERLEPRRGPNHRAEGVKAGGAPRRLGRMRQVMREHERLPWYINTTRGCVARVSTPRCLRRDATTE